MGRRFASKRGREALDGPLSDAGEWPPIDASGSSAWLFNPLLFAGDAGGLNTALTKANSFGDLESLTFHQDAVEPLNLFTCAFDGYMGLFCTEALKSTIASAALGGVTFGVDLANIFPSDPAAYNPTRH